jgi:hypothetical protein
VIRDGLGQRREAGREDRRIVEEVAEEGSLGQAIGPSADGLAGL